MNTKYKATITPRDGYAGNKSHLVAEIARHAQGRLLPSYPSHAAASKAAEREYYAECLSRELYHGCQMAYAVTVTKI